MDENILKEQIAQGFSTWKIAQIHNTTQPSIRYWLNKFDLKTERTIHKNNKIKKCPRCQVIKSLSEFSICKKPSSYCKKCLTIVNRERQQNIKQQAVEYLGGKCIKCGYNKCNAALEFHHINPHEKDKNYRKYSTFEKLKPELDKCVLLCSNCHKEHHLSKQV